MEEEERTQPELTPELRACAVATSVCYSACTETLTYSLEANPLNDARHIRLLLDCAEICQTAQNVMLRVSELAVMLSAVCVEVCELTAESCRSFGDSDEQLLSCAEVCDETAECCRRLAVV